MGKRRPQPAEATGEAHFSPLYIHCRLVCCLLQAGARADADNPTVAAYPVCMCV